MALATNKPVDIVPLMTELIFYSPPPPLPYLPYTHFVPDSKGSAHRRRIKTEEKAKIVASVWWEECMQFVAAQAVLPETIFKFFFN